MKPAIRSEYLNSLELEQLTGVPASTWRYWASIGQPPASLKLGRRRLWKRSVIEEWLVAQETTRHISDVSPH